MNNADQVRAAYMHDGTVSNEEFGKLVEDADLQDQAEELDAELDEQPCGCPIEYHLADCDGTRARTKDDYLEIYSRYDSMDDVPDDLWED